MRYVNMREIHDCMDWIDEFGMILACDMYGMIGYKSDMELVWTMILYWLMKHDVGVVRT